MRLSTHQCPDMTSGSPIYRQYSEYETKTTINEKLRKQIWKTDEVDYNIRVVSQLGSRLKSKNQQRKKILNE